MDRLIMLGTGHAMTTKCFNTCFVYENEWGRMLVDTGGGQQLVVQLRAAGLKAEEISCVFVSHAHTDHILGLPWLLRLRMRSLGEKPLLIVAHRELCDTIEGLIKLLLPEAYRLIGSKLTIIPVFHGEEKNILGRNLLFYDTGSREIVQFGFAMSLSGGRKFVFNGDVPFSETNRSTMENAAWLMHEAFCPEHIRHKGPPHHSSAAEAAQNAASLNAEKLILVHCGDEDMENRSEKYESCAREHFSGEILVPNDLDIINLT